ncbi:MAG: hypothetical protein H6Q17_2602 [Bacteroidetes bacterium]|nr:hypothetical protein [Bacteroidota bacterium]
MKAISCVVLFLLVTLGNGVSAQNGSYSEKYGSTLNIGLGIGGYSGYYGYVGKSVPVFNLNYEFDVAPQFTLAPSVTFYTYRDRDYRETVIPLAVKGTYYFDRLLNANSRWDFYLAGSLGFALTTSSWDNGYNGDRSYYQDGSNLFLDAHIGTEYHISKTIGIFLDISTGVSTIGLAIH